MTIATRHLYIRDKDLRTLEADIWSNEFVPAYMLHQNAHVPIEIRYRGGHTRTYPKRSFELARGETTIHLNAEYDDPSMLRNALSFQFFERIGVAAPRTNHCHLILNGRSLGVYLEIEAVDRQFFARRSIPVRPLFYAVNGNADFALKNRLSGQRKEPLYKGYTLEMGEDADKERLAAFIRKLNALGDKRLYAYIASRLDIGNYVRWLAGVVFTGNYDGFDHNYAIYEYGPRKRYRMVPWDYEGTWGRNCYGEKISSGMVRVKGYNKLTAKLMSYDYVRNLYKKTLKRIMRDTFTVGKIMPAVMDMHERIAPYIANDRGRKWTYAQFENEPAVIETYIRERRAIITEAIGNI